jgi:predicted tellurium resistance membrane protein TerC
MNKKILGFILIIVGFTLDIFAWSTKIGHPISTICLLLGIGLIIGGIVMTLIKPKKKAHTHNTV